MYASKFTFIQSALFSGLLQTMLGLQGRAFAGVDFYRMDASHITQTTASKNVTAEKYT